MSNKFAVCIGINDYPGTDMDLYGCVNDANDWAGELSGRGFSVTTLLDSHATKRSILGFMSGALGEARQGDTVVFTYSGHGTWVPDMDGDEPDGRDEALCPYDLMEGGPDGTVITDDELYRLFAQHRRRGVRLVFISDSCHSGSVSRFAQVPLIQHYQQQQPDRMVRFMPPEIFLLDQMTARYVEKLTATRKSRYAALLMSGCRDHEYSYDAYFEGRPNGAFTYAALKALRAMDPAGLHTYRNWHDVIRSLYLPSIDYPQTPQIDGTSDWKSWSPVL